MLKRKIVKIHEELCNGCELCVNACHEGAIVLVDGKAKLLSDEYCDGFGDCLPACPTGAIEIIEREAAAYDDELVQRRMQELKAGAKPHAHADSPKKGPSAHHHHEGGGCPGSMNQRIRFADPAQAAKVEQATAQAAQGASDRQPVFERPSELQQWPIQIQLVNPQASFFDDANLLIAADCTAYAYANFHNEFIKNHITLIGCPKLDDNQYYMEKLTEILSNHSIKSITVVRMVVPCCGGIVQSVRKAMLNSETIVPYREVTIGIDGSIIA